MSDSLSSEDIIWVVVKLDYGKYDGDIVGVAEEQGFSHRKYAETRAKHVMEFDNQLAWVYPVRVPWREQPAYAAMAPEWPPIIGALTTSRGIELHAYDEEQPRLSQVVGETWLSWRLQQAALGNLDEAGQAGPDTQKLAELYQEPHPTSESRRQLTLPGILEPVH